MNTNAEKSNLYFLERLYFCISEMLGFYKPHELVLNATQEAQERIYSILFGDVKNYQPKYLCGIEIVVSDLVDSSLGFEVCKK